MDNTNLPVDVSEIERLRSELERALLKLTGCQAKVEIWFHQTHDSNPRSLAHDAVLGNWKAGRTRQWNDKNKVSHISVMSPSRRVFICLDPRVKGISK